ncbi:Hypothetical predicted protein [Octopus vulgaris]|uniref:Uncharacterized protein n=1 Tax=Octopus vulgaris TaxID=6645 RepID=A0AA36EWR8_OCTVU|nr:Hypothetical predicted protein [Octopus vulgaris]
MLGFTFISSSSSSSFNVRFPCWHGLDGSTGVCEARRLHQAQSDLAVFLQLDALPSANHSVTVVGAFYVPDEADQQPRSDGAFYVPPARRPVGRRWLRPRSDGSLTCHRHWYHSYIFH